MTSIIQRFGALDRSARTAALASIAVAVIVAALVAGFVAGNGSAAVVLAGAMVAIATPGLLAVKATFEQARINANSEADRKRLERLVLTVSALEQRVNGQVDQRLRAAEATDRTHQSMLTEQRSTLGALETSQRSATARTDALETSAEASRGRIGALEERVRVLRVHLDIERQRRLAELAVRRSSDQVPPRVVVQMTLARSGSTRLFDMLRCHPDVFMEPSDRIWSELGLRGRRYPVGLSDLPGAATPIVASPNSGSLIRSMRQDDAAVADPPTGMIAVEKAHPSFYDFETDVFVAALSDFEARMGPRSISSIRCGIPLM